MNEYVWGELQDLGSKAKLHFSYSAPHDSQEWVVSGLLEHQALCGVEFGKRCREVRE